MGIIFDLDQTLIDTSSAEVHRKNRAFQQVYPLIPSFIKYDGIDNVFEFVNQHLIPTCIVTSSPSIYANKVTSHWGINVDFKVCYHDTSRKKPHPDPILKAIEQMQVTNDKILSIGDRDIDITASQSANVASVACLWGNSDNEALLKANPTYVASHPRELINIIKDFFDIED